MGPFFWRMGSISEPHSHPDTAALTIPNALKERTFPRIIFSLKWMCFTCYFRFIGVYLLLNNEPEGNGNLNRLTKLSQCHQKLPVLYCYRVATLFAYSAGQMCCNILAETLTLTTGLGFHPVSCLPVGKCEGGGCHSAPQHTRAVHVCHHEALRMR